MNSRVIQTTTAPLLIYRDQDEDGQPELVVRIDTAKNTIVQQRTSWPGGSSALVQAFIRKLSQADAQQLVDSPLIFD